MKKTQIALMMCLFFTGGLSVDVCSGSEIKDSQALALLRGVVAARSKCDSFRAEFNIVFRDVNTGQTARRYDCLVEQAGNLRRFEHLRESTELDVFLVDGDEVHGYRREEGGDVAIYDIERSVGIRGDCAFDFRCIGLVDSIATNMSVNNSFWFEECDSIEVIGDESIGGVSAIQIASCKGPITTNIWISAATFRVYRRTYDWSNGHVRIDSTYPQDDPRTPFPAHVFVTRTEGERKTSMTVDVQNLECGLRIQSSRFTLASLDLPLNTAVVDYRIKRRLGFWDGKGLVDHAVKPEIDMSDSTTVKQESGGMSRRLLLAINGVVVVALIAYLFLRRQHN